MPRRVMVLLLALIVGTFVVRTWRVRRDNAPASQEGQLVLDLIETDSGFLRRAPVVPLYKSEHETLADVLKRYSQLTGVKVGVHWEALAKVGIGPETGCCSMEFRQLSASRLIGSILLEAGGGWLQFIPLDYRCRRGILEVSTTEDLDADLVWRSHLMPKSMEQYRAIMDDARDIESAIYPHPSNDDERALGFFETHWHGMWRMVTDGRSDRMRLHEGKLLLHATLENQLILEWYFQYLRSSRRSTVNP